MVAKVSEVDDSTKTMDGEKQLKVVEKIVKEIFSLLGTKSTPKVTEDKENEAILIEIESDDESGLLIGNRGETLNSIQTIIGMIYRKRSGEWKRILVNIADWREKQTERLTQLARQTADRVKSSGQSQSLFNLNAGQRRIVHMALANDGDVETESAGEGDERYLVINPKTAK